MSSLHHLAARAQDDGFYLPEGAGSIFVWVFFLGVIAGLYVLVSRTRKRAEDEYWERKRQEEEHRELPEPDDPMELPGS
jgi:hypothetical protein